MIKKKILITGCCGFIGFALAKKILLSSKSSKIIGIDILDNYYSVKLKKERLNELKKFKNFKFFKLNLKNSEKIKRTLKSKKFEIIYHLAAQAGVRYSIINKQKYFDANIHGFFNLLEIFKNNKPQIFFFASSSSVYGDSKKYPSNEKEKLLPKNMYSLSKKINEDLGQIYSEQYNMKLIGLRFFTVFGEWGRPDMFLFKYFFSHFFKKTFFLNNNGNHDRDFTYIDDVVNVLLKMAAKKNKFKKFDVFNVCSNHPLNLNFVISFFKKIKVIPKIKNIKINKADVLKTHGNNKKLSKTIGKIKYTKTRISLLNTYNWYKENINLFK